MFEIKNVTKDNVDYIVMIDDEWVTMSNIDKKTSFGAGIRRDNKELFKAIYPEVKLRKGSQTFFKNKCVCKVEDLHHD